ncbi:MAG: hypothetical protein DSY43_00965 [Gammaproteobacteria bacterium]|nr:MAG: hypothetical protein DSY43_00965 [Gammaproteobacteria bacterium]
MAAVQSALTGEPNQLALPKELFSSPNLAIDARVSEKLQSKIWNNEYLDFSLLLSNPVLEGKYQLTVTTANNESSHALCLEPVSKSKKITSIETWISCFHIFVGVFTRKYPNEAPALMKYGEVVQELASRGQHWRFYDENFRFLRQSQPSSLPWGTIHWELWMRCHQQVSNKPTIPPTSIKSRNDNPPKGYCFKFSRGAKCMGCSFKHQCFKCEGSHQPKLCNFRAQPRSFKSRQNAGAPATKPKS